MKQEHKNSFIMQAGILAIAGIIVRIIGILYKSPLVMIIGDEGNGYYNTAYNIYTIILLVSSYSIPSAISKVIASRLEMKEYKNAHRLFIGSLVYVVIVGGIAGIVCFTCADIFVKPNSVKVLQIFAPTIFLSGLLGCLRGYFQAHKTMLETSVSQILEQILNALVSVFGAYVLIGMVAQESDTVKAIYGAMGSALGTGSGVLIALIFMFALYLKRRSKIMADIKEDNCDKILGNKEVAKILVSMVTPVVLSTCIYNLSTASNLKIYQNIKMDFFHEDEVTTTTMYGLFSGKAMQIINIPIALASAMSSAIIPVISGSYERKAFDETKAKIASAIKVTMLIAIPASVGLFVLSRPVTILLYPQAASVDIVARLIKVLAIAVVFYCLSTLSNGILQGTGYVNKPVTNAAIALVVQASFLTLSLFFTGLDLYALCLANVIYSFLMCILNGSSIRKKLEYKQEVKKTFVIPAISSVIMGIVSFGVYMAGKAITGAVTGNPNGLNWKYNAVFLVINLIISAIVYFVVLIKLKGITADEFDSLPKGRTLKKIAAKLHLL